MTDFLSTALTGLFATQRALATASHNITNVNTPGFSRQRVELGALPPDLFGGNFIGNGVEVSSVRRLYDAFLTDQMRVNTSEHQRLEQFSQMAGLIDDVLADPQGGVSPALKDFFAAVQDLSNDSAGVPERIALLSAAKNLAARFSGIAQRLNDQEAEINDTVRSSVQEINDLATGLTEINRDILSARVPGSRKVAPDLLDKRDEILRQLSELVEVNVTFEANGMANVFMGKGQALVNGVNRFQLTTVAQSEDPSQLNIAYLDVFGNTQDITAQIRGGELGGALDFRHKLLDEVRNGLGRLATTIASSFNAQHRQGMDLNGDLGGDFFRVSGPVILPNANNGGSGALTATITDVTQLSTQNYRLRYDGSNYTLESLDGSSSVTGAGPNLTLDGFSVNVTTAPAVGDSFLIKPTAQAASGLEVMITEPDTIAAAGPIKTAEGSRNTGNASISAGSVLDVTNPALLDAITIVFNDPPNTFDITDAAGAVLLAGQAYTSGDDIDFNGWRIQISGRPTAGDEFNVSSNAGGTGDNRNALALAGLQSTGFIANGSATFQEAYDTVVGIVGSQTREANTNRDVQLELLNHVRGRRDAVSGVNLEEEAGELSRFVQAYQAARKVMTTSEELFDVLLRGF